MASKNATTKTSMTALANFIKKTTQNYNIFKLWYKPRITGIYGQVKENPLLNKSLMPSPISQNYKS